MTTKSFTLSDGTKLTTSSARTYVTFTVSDDSRVTVQKRTDSQDTAVKNHLAAKARGYCRTVTVSFHESPHILLRQVFQVTPFKAWRTVPCDD